MENKKSFILYSDQKELFDSLPDEMAGKLIKHIFSYVNDENPQSDSPLVNIAFVSIKAALKRDLERWKGQIQQRSEAGKASAEKRKQVATESNENQRPLTSVNENQRPLNIVDERARNPTDNVNVNVSVNENVNVTEKKNNIEGRKLKFAFGVSLLNYGFKKELVEEWMVTRKEKKAVNTEAAFNRFIEQVEKSGKPINEILEQICANQWKGFNADWLNESQPAKPEKSTPVNHAMQVAIEMGLLEETNQKQIQQ